VHSALTAALVVNVFVNGSYGRDWRTESHSRSWFQGLTVPSVETGQDGNPAYFDTSSRNRVDAGFGGVDFLRPLFTGAPVSAYGFGPVEVVNQSRLVRRPFMCSPVVTASLRFVCVVSLTFDQPLPFTRYSPSCGRIFAPTQLRDLWLSLGFIGPLVCRSKSHIGAPLRETGFPHAKTI